MGVLLEFMIKHWIELVSGCIVGFGSFAFKQLHAEMQKNQRETELTKQGILSLLRNGIIDCYCRYQEKEYIPIYAMENVTKMYEAYHDLGGNGTITKIYKELEELPTKGKSMNE